MPLRAIFLVFLTVLVFACPGYAIDLGGGGGLPQGGGDDPVKVEVANETPIGTFDQTAGVVREITASAQLDFNQDYKSSYLDVRNYRTADIYAIPEKVLNEPQPVIRYKLDAFFSVDAGMSAHKKFGAEEAETLAGAGAQEFGAAEIEAEDGAERAVFVRTTTGATQNRVLHTAIYGPFLRVVLTNLAEGERRRYRLVAYLSR